MLPAVAVEASETEASAELPSLVRLTERVTESPGTKPVVVTGIAKAPDGWARLMSTVPEATVVFRGAVLSVKVPKVPSPATAAAVPAMASEPTTFLVVLRVASLLMAADLLCQSPSPGVPGDRNDSGGPTAGVPRAIRKESARVRRGTRRTAVFRRKTRPEPERYGGFSPKKPRALARKSPGL